MSSQISFFDGETKYKITKPIRTIECFAGYSSQSLALDYLGVKHERWRICEWAVKSIIANKDMHCPNDNTDYSKDMSFDQVVDYLCERCISMNYNDPMTKAQIVRMGEPKCRLVYNDIIATHNLVSVCNTHASDLGIVDTDKYCYIMTYSFPCQDLSLAGKQKGMAKDSGTRSGLLWEIERMLDECNELPQVLLMENVPEVIGANNVKHFAKWIAKLDSLGYKSYWQVLNAKDYGIPQNRERCFMVSILGDYYFEFPEKQRLEIRLKDLLESHVDESFYLSEKKIQSIANWKAQQDPLKDIDKEKTICPCLTARGAGEEHSGMVLINEKVYNDIEPKLVGGIGEKKSNNGTQYYQQDRVYDSNEITMCHPASIPGGSYNYLVDDDYKGTFRFAQSDAFMIGKKRYTEGKVVSDTLQTQPKEGIVDSHLRIRKLTPRECFRLMGVKDEDFDKISMHQSNQGLYHLAGDSIVTNVLMAIFKQLL